MAFPPTATFGQLLPFQTSFKALTFLIAGNRGCMANSTAKGENPNDNESDRLAR